MKIVCFAGAGLSTASGIRDFKGDNGLYKSLYLNKYKPEDILHINTLGENPKLFYNFYRENMLTPNNGPNAAHLAIKKLEDANLLTSVITQNIDGLEYAAGIKNVRQLHGTVHRNYCIECGKEYDLEFIKNTKKDEVPRCECDGLIRPDVVMYGEMLNDSYDNAITDIATSDILVVLGSSLTVYPAAGLLEYFQGKEIYVFNKDTVKVSNLTANIHYITEPLEETFPKFVNKFIEENK